LPELSVLEFDGPGITGIFEEVRTLEILTHPAARPNPGVAFPEAAGPFDAPFPVADEPAVGSRGDRGAP